MLNAHFSQLIQFFLQVSANRGFSAPLRVMALNFLMCAVMYKKSKLLKLQLVGPLIQTVLPIGAEPEPADEDDESPVKVAFQVLNTLGTSLAPQHVFPAVAEQLVSYAQHSDANHRKAAMLAIAVLVDGCADYIRPKMGDILPFVCAGLQDSETFVRKAACMALGTLCGLFAVLVLVSSNVHYRGTR